MEQIHEILAELETNLKDLESAKSQVMQVTESSNNVNATTLELITKLEGFINLVSNNTLDFSEDFSKTLTKYKQEVEKLIEKIKTETNEETKNIRKLTSAFIDAINTEFDDFGDKTSNTFKELEVNLNQINTNFNKSTDNQIEKVNKSIQSFDELIEKQKNDFTELKHTIVNDINKENKINRYLLIAIVVLILVDLIMNFSK